jgi:hypothetical protein
LKSNEIKGSKTIIIFAVLEVYYVNKKAEEQNQISYMIDESISEIVPIELLKRPANVRNESNPEQVSQELVNHLNRMEDSIKEKINNDLKNIDKQAEIKDINFTYITEIKNDSCIGKIDSQDSQNSQNRIVKAYIKVEYSYKTKYSTRKKIIELPMYSYDNSIVGQGIIGWQQEQQGQQGQPKDSKSLSLSGD